MAELEYIWLDPRRIKIREGAQDVGRTVTFDDTVSSVTVTAYLGTKDVTATVYSTGTQSISGKVLTLKTFSAFAPGKIYVVKILGTVAGLVWVWAFEYETQQSYQKWSG